MSEVDLLDDTVQQSDYKGPVSKMPGAGSTLAMSIGSLLLCYNVVGIILCAMTIVNSTRSISEYEKNPAAYFESSYKQFKAARLIARISIGMGIVVFIVLIAWIASLS